MNLKTWFVYFGILQTISMVASLYQALATQQVIGLISANPLHFGLFTFFASLLSMTGYIVCGFLVDEKGPIKILILAQVALFIFNIFLFIVLFFPITVYFWILVVGLSFFFISFESLSRGQVILEAYHKKFDGPSGLKSVGYDLLIINFSKLFGFSIGAILLTIYHPKIAFLVNAISYIMMYFWLKKEEKHFVQKKLLLNNYQEKLASFLSVYLITIKEIKNNFKIKMILINEFVFAFLLFPINTQAFLFNQKINSPLPWGLLLFFMSLGSIVFNLLINKDNLRLFNTVWLCAILIIFSFFLLISENYYLVYLGLFLIGGALNTILVVGRGRIQNEMPSEIRAKTFSFVQLLYSLATGLGTILFANLIYFWGFKLSFMVFVTLLITYLLIIKIKLKNF